MACVTDPKAQTTRFVVGLILAVVMLGASRADAQPGPGSPAIVPASATMLATQQVPARGPKEKAPDERENEIVRSPDTITPSTPPQGLLESAFPTLREGLSQLPPFFRDTDLNVRLRTFYFNRQNDDDTASEAWALGGWIQYTSGWLADTFAMGATYYTSLPLYAPDSRPGSLLLTPGQDAIGTFGEAWARAPVQGVRPPEGGPPEDRRGLPEPAG